MKFFLVGLLLWLSLQARAQPSLQVVNKVIEKTMSYQPGRLIQINAQKADISIKGWNRPTVLVQLKLQAKHPQRTIAEQEVIYHHYTLADKGGQITMANGFVIPQRAGKLQSQLKAIYEISLPHQAIVRLADSFGDIQINELAGDISITLEFGKLTLSDIKGKLRIQSDYGDIEGSKLNTRLQIKAEKADIVLEELGGLVDIHSQYGRLAVAPTATLQRMTIEADRTDLSITIKRLADFQFEVSTVNAPIWVPETVLQHLVKAGHKQLFSYQLGGLKPTIIIKNSYNPVTIQGEKPVVTK